MLIIDHNAVVQAAYGLPALHQSAARLTYLLTTEEPDLREIGEVIEYDPSLTMKLLRLANSAVSGSRYRIGTVRDALIRLGTGVVGGFVMGSCVRPLTGKNIPGYGIPEKEYWSHSLTAAFAAESIQSHSTKWAGKLAFTAALLHDIGKLVLGQFLDEELSSWLRRAVTEGNQAAYQAEREILSLHHGEAGGIIAQHWALPESLTKGIVYHHEPDEGGDGICYVTYLADLVAHRVVDEQRSVGAALTDWDADAIGPALTELGLAESDLVRVCADAHRGLQAASGQLP